MVDPGQKQELDLVFSQLDRESLAGPLRVTQTPPQTVGVEGFRPTPGTRPQWSPLTSPFQEHK